MHMPSEFASLRQGMTTDTSTASVSTFVANVVICGLGCRRALRLHQFTSTERTISLPQAIGSYSLVNVLRFAFSGFASIMAHLSKL
jgi:hypothetical protein